MISTNPNPETLTLILTLRGTPRTLGSGKEGAKFPGEACIVRSRPRFKTTTRSAHARDHNPHERSGFRSLHHNPSRPNLPYQVVKSTGGVQLLDQLNVQSGQTAVVHMIDSVSVQVSYLCWPVFVICNWQRCVAPRGSFHLHQGMSQLQSSIARHRMQ